jgi:hypothetical protein
MTRSSTYGDQRLDSEPDEKLKPYQQPRLTEYGDIRELTQGGGGDFEDMGNSVPYG